MLEYIPENPKGAEALLQHLILWKQIAPALEVMLKDYELEELTEENQLLSCTTDPINSKVKAKKN